MNKTYRLLLMFMLFAGSVMAQDSAKHALTISAGAGMYDGDLLSGEGVDFGVGYQRQVIHERIRLHASANFGTYRDVGAASAKKHFSSMDIKADLNYDLIRYRAFSFIIGAGMMYEYTQGIIDPGVYVDYIGEYVIYLHRETRFFAQSNLGANLLVGFRYGPDSQKYAIELLPLYSSVGLEESYYKLMGQLRAVYRF